MVTDLILKTEVYAIVATAMDVYNTLGSGFLESVYQEAMEIELTARGVPHSAQKELKVSYKGQILKKGYQADLVCYGKVIVELKAIEHLGPSDSRQLLNYLEATQLAVGVLINFGNFQRLDWKRMVLTHRRQQTLNSGAPAFSR